MEKNLKTLVSEYMIVTPDIDDNDILVEDLTKEEGLEGMYLVLPDDKVRAFEDRLVESEIPQRRTHMRQLLTQDNALQVILSNLLKKGGYLSYLDVLQSMFGSINDLLEFYGLIEEQQHNDYVPSDIVDSVDNYESVNTDYEDIEDEPIEVEEEPVQEEAQQPQPVKHTPSVQPKPVEEIKQPQPSAPVRETIQPQTVTLEQPATAKVEEVNQTYAEQDSYTKSENDILKKQNEQLTETLNAMQDMMKSFIEMQQAQVRFNNIPSAQEPVIPEFNPYVVEAVQPTVEDDVLTDEDFYNCIDIVKSKVGNMPVLDFIVEEFQSGNRDSAAESLEQIIINLEKGGVSFE